MNKLNLARLRAAYGISAEIVQSPGSGSAHLRIGLESGRAIGVAGPPRPHEDDRFSPATAHRPASERRFIEPDPSIEVANDALDAFGRRERALSEARANRNLSDTGRTALARDDAAVALAGQGKAFAALTGIAGKLQKQRADLYAVPAASAVEVPADGELRAAFAAMTPAERAQALSKIAGGDPRYTRLLTALSRAPLPLDDETTAAVNTAWLGKVAREKPDQVAALKAAEESSQWGMNLTQALASHIAGDPNAGLDRFSAFKLLRPTGGAAVLTFSPTEAEHLDLRLAAAEEAAADKAAASKQTTAAA
jgi:hypothetical protein